MNACSSSPFRWLSLSVLRSVAVGWALLAFCGTAGFAQTTRPAAKRKAARPAAPESRPTEPAEAAPRSPKDKYPPVEARVAAYREQLEAKKIKREDTLPYLVAGVEVIGISETARGYTAFIRVEDGATLVARAGMRFYDGVVERIEPGRIVFRLNNRRLVEKRYGQALDAEPDQSSPER